MEYLVKTLDKKELEELVLDLYENLTRMVVFCFKCRCCVFSEMPHHVTCETLICNDKEHKQKCGDCGCSYCYECGFCANGLCKNQIWRVSEKEKE